MSTINGATMSQKEAAEYLGISVQSLSRMEETGNITRLNKLPGVRYSSSQIAQIAGDGKTYGQVKAERERDEAIEEARKLRERLRQIAGIAL